jgi:hypothetical protein
VAHVSAAGVSGIRSMLLPQGSSVEGVIMAYIVAATTSVAFVCGWGLGGRVLGKLSL